MGKLEKTLPAAARAAFWLLLAFQALAYARISTDDAFIFYRYAANVAAGRGYVFNAGERVLGTTSPLYTLMLAAAQRLFGWLPGMTLPVLGSLISTASMAVVALLAARFFRRAGRDHAALLAPLVMLAVALFWSGVGMDVLPALAFGMAAIACHQDGRVRWASAAAACAVLARPDLACVPALLSLDWVIVQRRRPEWASVAIFAVLVAAWLAFSQAYFGTLVPTSVVAKLGQAGTGAWGGRFAFLAQFHDLWPAHASIRDATLVLFVIALPLAVTAGRRYRDFRAGWLVLLWIGAYLVAYGLLLRPAPYPWYYAPLALGMGIVFTMGLDMLVGRAFTRSRSVGVSVAILAIAYLGFAGAYQAARTLREPRHYKYRFFSEAAAWLNERAAPGAVVACNEIGVLGYTYEKGPILDLMGLANPEVATHVSGGDFAWPVKHHEPDYVIFKYPPFPKLEDLATDTWFLDRYTKVAIFGDGPTKIALYARNPTPADAR
jgi:hypothetical protein